MKNPIISSVKASTGNLLQITWENGKTSQVDLSAVIKTDKALKCLNDKSLFKKVKTGLWGHSVQWGKKIDIGADTLWTMAHEQAGIAMPTDDFNSWMKRNALSLSDISEILGMTRRMIIYYHMGHRPIPKVISLACKGYDALQKERKLKKAA